MMRILLCAIICASLGCSSENKEQSMAEGASFSVASQAKEVIEYHENGVIKLKGQSIDGKRTGRWDSFYPNGYKWSEANYRNGLKDGPTSTYYPNGIMRYQGFYSNDERSGLWIFYDTLGVAVSRMDMDTVSASLGQTLANPAP